MGQKRKKMSTREAKRVKQTVASPSTVADEGSLIIDTLAVANGAKPQGIDREQWNFITGLLTRLARALEIKESVTTTGSNQLHSTVDSRAGAHIPVHSQTKFSSTEEHLRLRSAVISGVTECDPSMPTSQRAWQDYETVSSILSTLKVEAVPVTVYRMGKAEQGKPRLLKVVLPTRGHLLTALKNSKSLNSRVTHVNIRPSYTAEQRREINAMLTWLRLQRQADPHCPFVLYREELWDKRDIQRGTRINIPNYQSSSPSVHTALSFHSPSSDNRASLNSSMQISPTLLPLPRSPTLN